MALSLEQIKANSKRKTLSVFIRAFDGEIVLQELTAADVLWMMETAAGNLSQQQQIRVALSIQEPVLGNTREEKVATLDLMLRDIGEIGWDELYNATQAFQSTNNLTPTEWLRRALESIPELWKVVWVLDRTKSWMADLDEITISKINSYMALFEIVEGAPAKNPFAVEE